MSVSSKLKLLLESHPLVTPEMENWFYERIKSHILSVQEFAKKLEDAYPEELKGLYENSLKHDQSKFEEPELYPYVLLTWEKKHPDKFQAPKDLVHEATTHHVKTNKHHAEYFDPKATVNPIYRDDPSGRIVDATKMDTLSLAEMCADWMAVGKEFGNTGKQWADRNVNIRWKFAPEQVKKIYKYLEIENT